MFYFDYNIQILTIFINVYIKIMGQKRKRSASDDDMECCNICNAEDNLDMVQCDICKEWSHFHCAGVGPEIEHEKWSCHICKGDFLFFFLRSIYVF